MSNNAGMIKDAERWPKIADAYKRACQKAFEARMKKRNTNTKWHNGLEMYDWWISGKAAEKDDPDQQVLFFD